MKIKILFALICPLLLTAYIAESADVHPLAEYWLQRLDMGEMNLPSKYGLLTSERWSYGKPYERNNLNPVPNPNPYAVPQPHRDHPYNAVVSPDGEKIYIVLLGTEFEPGHEIAVYDTTKKQVVKRIAVGSRPFGLAFHPDGRYLVVTNHYSNFASVIDTEDDEVCDEIPLDYYCQDLIFTSDGSKLYISNRYLAQIFIVECQIKWGKFLAHMRPIGGFDEETFLKGKNNLNDLLVNKCGNPFCHGLGKGGYKAGPNALENYFSAIYNAIPQNPDDSVLLQAVISEDEGGFADALATTNNHNGGVVVFSKDDKDYQRLADWIEKARYGPGIPVGNPGAKPYNLALSHDERYLFVANWGTQEVSVVDLEKEVEVTAIFTQNVGLDVDVYYDEATKAEYLLIVGMGIGFGAPKERDPYGGETWDRDHPAAQFSLIRDLNTSLPLPLEQQSVLGPFDAIDGTAAFKMRDIQNDVICVNLNELKVPSPLGRGQLQYAVKANRYEAHKEWVRYTSDTAETLANDIRGDIPPDLMRVVGAFPEAVAIHGEDVFIAMSGTYQLVHWKINPQPSEYSDLLEPVAVYDTGVQPRYVDVSPNGRYVYVTNFMGESLTIIDLQTQNKEEIIIGDLSRPVPDSNAERGEMFVHTSVFTVDQDTTCLSCHIDDTSDARSWGAGQVAAQLRNQRVVSGGLLAIPQLRNLYDIQPFYFEGTHTAYDSQMDDAREHVANVDFEQANPAGDFTNIKHPEDWDERKIIYEEVQEKVDLTPLYQAVHDLDERRDEFTRQQTLKYFGKAFNFNDFQRFIGDFQSMETRLIPNPFDQRHPSVVRGKVLFNDTKTGCIVCHKPPSFTNKEPALTNNQEKALPALLTITPRDASFTLFSPSYMDYLNGKVPDVAPWDKGRAQRNEGEFTTFQLRGLFDRPRALLHHGRAMSLRETICSPKHYSLRLFKYDPLRGGEYIRNNGREKGFNEIELFEEGTYMLDTHGGTSHLNAYEVQDLVNFLLSIE